MAAATVLVLAGMMSSPTLAQPAPGLRLSGTTSATSSQGFSSQTTFTCDFDSGASGPCVGSYNAIVHEVGCSNSFSVSNTLIVNGLNLNQPGPIQGNFTATNGDYDEDLQPNGTCTIIASSIHNLSDNFSGTWDGTNGSLTFTPVPIGGGMVIQPTGTLKRVTASAPVFPLAVTASIDALSATARADIQFRAQDVGTTGSVYAFALAPASIVRPPLGAVEMSPKLGMAKTSGGKDTAVACVLAQLNASGQLSQVSASSMQAFVTGVLSSQGQSVNVINGVATVNISGSVFYVGYGPNATAMLNGGINRRVVPVPGALECKPAAPQTGWWWYPPEDGRGYSIEVNGSNIFFAAFLYDTSGRSNWYVATGKTSLDGSLFTGDLLGVKSGQTLFGAYRAPGPVASLGPMTLAFNSATSGTMVWPGGTVPLERFNIVPNGLTAPAQANLPEAGWWWNPAESGRGFFIEWQNGSADLAGYMYDDAGEPVWYLTVQQTPDPRLITGNWWTFADGQTLLGAWKPNRQSSSNFAPVTVQFTSTTTATMSLPGGRTTSLVRHRF